MLLLAVLFVAQFAFAAADNVVAKINDVEITTGELALEFQLMDPTQARELLQTEEGKKQVIETLIRRKLLLASARANKLDTLSSTQIRMRRSAEDALLQVMLRAIGQTAVQPKKEDVRKVYDENDTTFYSLPSLRVLRIVAKDEKNAQDISKELQKGTKFEDLMTQNPGFQNVRTGDLGWLETDKIVPEIKGDLTKLSDGQFTKPLKIGDTFQIFKVMEHRKEGKLPFDAVEAYITQNLQSQLNQETLFNYQSNLWSNNKIEIKDNVLKDFGKPAEEPKKK